MRLDIEPGETLVLSYGMGVYRLLSGDPLDLESTSCKNLDICDILKTDEGHYIAISRIGKLPSSMEIAIQETAEFRYDESYAIRNGSDGMKNRFYELHRVSVVGS